VSLKLSPHHIRLNEIFRYAATEELIEFNPADNLGQRFSKPKKQNMPALPPSELPAS
jgi:hypothetical protein